MEACLEKAFPFCNDTSSISESGFRPHLSVGQWPKVQIHQIYQFKQIEVASAEKGFNSEWKPIEFTGKDL